MSSDNLCDKNLSLCFVLLFAIYVIKDYEPSTFLQLQSSQNDFNKYSSKTCSLRLHEKLLIYNEKSNIVLE